MRISDIIQTILFPPKCTLCGNLLNMDETDLCRTCRIEAPIYPPTQKKIPFVAQWSVLWYYKDNVRKSLLRYKFYGRQNYASVYGRLLAMKLRQELPDFDVLTWVPISAKRLRKRGYDQVELLANAIGTELGIVPTKTLRKIRHNSPQSRLSSLSARKANVLGVYETVDNSQFAGKTVLLLDDIITTGSTVSEASRVLLTAGAKEVICGAIAATQPNQLISR